MSVPADKLMELMGGPRSAGGGAPSGMNMPGMAPAAAPSRPRPPHAQRDSSADIPRATKCPDDCD